jgi:hypothetical protein
MRESTIGYVILATIGPASGYQIHPFILLGLPAARSDVRDWWARGADGDRLARRGCLHQPIPAESGGRTLYAVAPRELLFYGAKLLAYGGNRA